MHKKIDKPEKIAILACGVFDWNLQKAIENSGGQYEYIKRLLPARLHNNPRRLRERLRKEIEKLEYVEGLKGICLAFGLCGRGTIDLQAGRHPLIIPRVQDCIGLFLGGHQRYLKEFKHHPGTRYMSHGWYESRIRRANEDSENYYDSREGSLYTPEFEELKQAYGEENARFIDQFRESWKRNYTRAAYIKFPQEDENPPGEDVMRAIGRELDWQFRRLPGDNSLLELMLQGNWNHPSLLVVPPHSRTVAAPGNAILEYTTQLNLEEALEKHKTAAQEKRSGQVEENTGVGLGIDTGGTYTDAVIYDFAKGKVAASAKSPTTHSELVLGIREALKQLPQELLSRVTRAAVSTTLATNAFIEKKGRKVALLLMSPTNIEDHELPFRFVHRIKGRMSIDGREIEPLSEEEVKSVALAARQAGCEAFAISGFGATANPQHEKEAARLTCEITGCHSVCGHELSSKLNFYERATTAAMNARLIPLIEELLGSIKEALAEQGLREIPVMVVKGDGSLMLDKAAARVPVETIMSGPAASLVGAAFLSGVDNAVAVDMGGTTLDVARLRDGKPVLTDEGAMIGDFRTCVQAMRIHTSGLGGDSEIDLSQWPRVQIGPRRIEPISRLPQSPSEISLQFEHSLRQTVSIEAHVLEFFESVKPESLSQKMAEVLSDGPVSSVQLAEKLGRPGPGFIKWRENESNGSLLRYGLTLTDVLHAENRLELYPPEKSSLLLNCWSRLLNVDVEEIIRKIHQEFRKRVVLEIISSLAPEEKIPWRNTPSDDSFTEWLAEHLASKSFEDRSLCFSLSSPVVLLPVGAPAPLLFPQLRDYLGMDLRICEHASVANGVGAIAGEVMLREEAYIRITEDNSLLCTWRGGNQQARNIEEALNTCKQELAKLLQKRSEENQIPYTDPAIDIIPHQADTPDGKIMLGVTVEALLRFSHHAKAGKSA